MFEDQDAITTHFEKVRIKRPSDAIIEQISRLITSGVLKPGQRLPSERALAERFEVGRAHIREALHKLELYGIVHTLPQSGTFIEKIGVQTLERLIRTVLGMEEMTFEMMIEVRGVLEVFAADLAARRASPGQLAEIRKVYEQQAAEMKAGEDSIETDILFHIRLADATDNVLLRSLISLMRPDLMRFAQQYRTLNRPREALEEHRRIIEAVESRSPTAASEAMRHHINMSRDQHRDR